MSIMSPALLASNFTDHHTLLSRLDQNQHDSELSLSLLVVAAYQPEMKKLNNFQKALFTFTKNLTRSVAASNIFVALSVAIAFIIRRRHNSFDRGAIFHDISREYTNGNNGSNLHVRFFVLGLLQK